MSLNGTVIKIGNATPRSVARHVALSLLAAASDIGEFGSRALARPRVQFLHLHHVRRDEETGFRKLLEWLVESHCVVGYSEAVRRVADGDIDRNYVCLSFDDGLKNCATAARIMSGLGVKGCFFVCPSIIGEVDPAAVAAFCDDRLQTPVNEFLSWDDVAEMAAAGHEFGSHTMCHARLWQASGRVLEDEIAGSYEALKQRLGSVEHFAWPFGGFEHITREASEAVYAAGFESCASAVRGCHSPAPPVDRRRLCIRRDHVVASWPLSHIRYFMAANSRRMSEETSHWPPHLAPAFSEAGA